MTEQKRPLGITLLATFTFAIFTIVLLAMILGASGIPELWQYDSKLRVMILCLECFILLLLIPATGVWLLKGKKMGWHIATAIVTTTFIQCIFSSGSVALGSSIHSLGTMGWLVLITVYTTLLRFLYDDRVLHFFLIENRVTWKEPFIHAGVIFMFVIVNAIFFAML